MSRIALTAAWRRAERISRRRVVAAVALAWLGGQCRRAAAQSARVRRIGYLGYTAVDTPDDERDLSVFARRLRELGFVEGENLAIEWRYAEGRTERYDDFAAEFARQGVELVVVGSGARVRPPGPRRRGKMDWRAKVAWQPTLSWANPLQLSR